MSPWLIRLIIIHRHQDSGYFIQDHGLAQMLTQNDYWRKEFVNDKKFLHNMIRIFPKQKAIIYIYLKSNKKISVSRTVQRDRKRLFSDALLKETEIILEQIVYERKEILKSFKELLPK